MKYARYVKIEYTLDKGSIGMTLTYDYLQKKKSACNLITKRMDSVIKDGTAQQSGNIKSHLKNVRELRDNLLIKELVVGVMSSLYLPNSLDVTEDTFKPIHRVLFNSAYQPKKNINKLISPLFRSGFRHEQREAIKSMVEHITSEPILEKRQLLAKRIISQMVRERSSRLDPASIENIVLAGGGAKGFSLARIPEALNNNEAKSLKRIAGTSAGAILGSLMAFGYSSKELESLVLNNQFGLFTKDSRLSIGPVEKLSENTSSSLLSPFSDNAYASNYHKLLISELLCRSVNLGFTLPHDVGEDLKKFYADKVATLTGTSDEVINQRRDLMTKIYDKVAIHLMKNDDTAQVLEDTFFNKLDSADKQRCVNLATRLSEASFSEGNRYFTQLYPTSEQAVRFAVRDVRGQDLIVGYFEDLMAAKLQSVPPEILKEVFGSDNVDNNDLRRVNFEQLKHLHDKMPDQFKEFYCTIAIKRSFSSRVQSLLEGSYSRYDHQDISHKHDILSKMSVADAVRVSMNLPGIYPSYPFEVGGKKYSGADGGVISNLSIQVFDDHFPPEKTMCVIYASDKKLRAAENLYQLLMHPRSESEIKRDIEISQLAISSLGDKRNKLSKIVKSQRSKSYSDNMNNSRSKILFSAEKRLEKIEDNLNSLRFRRAVLDHEIGNVGARSIMPISISDSLASKRYRGQYLPQDLNRTVLVNTGAVNTLDFKLGVDKKQDLINAGFEATNDVLSGRDDLELHFLRNKCAEYEHLLSLDKIEIIRDYIYQEKEPDIVYMDAMRFVFSRNAFSENKTYHNEAIEVLDDVLYTHSSKLSGRVNNSLNIARSAWRDMQMSHKSEYQSMDI